MLLPRLPCWSMTRPARKNLALAPIAIRTVRGYRSVLENHVSRKRADIGRVPAHKLTGRDIRQWMDALAADGVGVGTISNARRVVGAALAWEVREGRLGVNPATHVRIDRGRACPSGWTHCRRRGSRRFGTSPHGWGWTGATSRLSSPIAGWSEDHGRLQHSASASQ